MHPEVLVSLSGRRGRSEVIMYLPVERLHLQGDTLVTKFEQSGRTGWIDEVIILD